MMCTEVVIEDWVSNSMDCIFCISGDYDICMSDGMQLKFAYQFSRKFRSETILKIHILKLKKQIAKDAKSLMPQNKYMFHFLDTEILLNNLDSDACFSWCLLFVSGFSLPGCKYPHMFIYKLWLDEKYCNRLYLWIDS